jgi:hypothetical protein
MKPTRSQRIRAIDTVLLAIAFVGCSDEEQGAGSTLADAATAVPSVASTQPALTASSPTTPATTSTLLATTLAMSTTTIPATPTPTTTQAAASTTTPAASTTTATTVACVAPEGTGPVEDGFPNRLSSLVGSDIRTGAHECFERVVIELAGTGDVPGVRVEYVDDPIHLSPSDQTVEVAGEATLVISVAAWMPSMVGDGYDGPTQFEPDNVSHILELRQIENFEGMTAWAVGVDSERGFTVDFLDSPVRIVVDIASG